MQIELAADMLAPGRAVYSELLALNRREVDAFNGIVGDYLAGMQMIRELQVRAHPPTPPAVVPAPSPAPGEDLRRVHRLSESQHAGAPHLLDVSASVEPLATPHHR